MVRWANALWLRLKVVARFPRADRAAATDLVSRLIDGYAGRELGRVLHVVLAMADGDLASLADAVRLAQGDYRDVLAFEGFIGAGKLRSEPAREWLENEFAVRGMAVPNGLRYRRTPPVATLLR
jgi:hypothetical protein